MKNATGSLAILGSGETSPNLVSVHRELLNGLDDSSDIFMIDSPFGFQENANQLVEKIIDFYKVSLNVDMKLATYRKIEELHSKCFTDKHMNDPAPPSVRSTFCSLVSIPSYANEATINNDLFDI